MVKNEYGPQIDTLSLFVKLSQFNEGCCLVTVSGRILGGTVHSPT